MGDAAEDAEKRALEQDEIEAAAIEILDPEEAETLMRAEQSAEVVLAERAKPQPVVELTALPGDHEMVKMKEIANDLAQTTFVPKGYRGKPYEIIAAILYGREIGLGPMQALQQIHIIEGKPSLSADGMMAKMRQGGLMVLDSEASAYRAMIHARRTDTGEEGTVEWTIEEAQAAGLVGKDNWRKYPADMLWARAVGRLARRMGSDMMNGLVYSAEEVQDWEPDTPRNQVGATASRVITTSDGTIELRADAPRGWKGIHEQLVAIMSEEVALGWMRACLASLTGSESREDVEETALRDAAIRIANGVAHLHAEHGGGFPPPDREMISRAFGHADSVGTFLHGPDIPHDPQEADAAAASEAVSDEKPEAKGSGRAKREKASDAALTEPLPPMDDTIEFGDDRSQQQIAMDDAAVEAAGRDG